MALVVMLNNYFHDLATAVFAAAAAAAYWLHRSLGRDPLPAALAPVIRGLTRLAWVALAWILAGGAVRAWAYRDYEWMEAAGRDQVPALVAKHVVLVLVVGLGVFFLIKLRARLRAAMEGR